MQISTDIARRYLFSKKSTSAINLITGISILGIAIGTAALILILSVFNGFKGLLGDMFDAFNPDLKVELIEGKSWMVDTTMLQEIKAIDGVAQLSLSLEEVALFEYDDTQKIGTIKGVDDAYAIVTDIDTTIISGTFKTRVDNINYGVVGMGLSGMLGINHNDAITPMVIYMLQRKNRGPLAQEFTSKELYPSGIFSVRGESDMKYLITSIAFVNRLLDLEGHASAIELRLRPGADEQAVRQAVLAATGPDYTLSNKYEQNETFLKIMNIEKWVSYLITCLTLLLIAFNLVGALWMIVLDKRRDISILRSIGMTTQDIQGIYKRLGLLITSLGMVLGIGLALLLYYLQKTVGIIHIPDGFMMTAYPIELGIWDFVIVPCTVLVIGYLASILPSRVAGEIESSLR